MKKFEFLDHKADVKFQAFGKTLEEAFKNSSLATKEVITEHTDLKIKETEKKDIEVSGEDLGALLYNFIEEIIYLLDAENFILSEVKNLKIYNKNRKLSATFSGDIASRYKFRNSVKAVTYNNMFIKKQGNKFVTQVVLDV